MITTPVEPKNVAFEVHSGDDTMSSSIGVNAVLQNFVANSVSADEDHHDSRQQIVDTRRDDNSTAANAILLKNDVLLVHHDEDDAATTVDVQDTFKMMHHELLLLEEQMNVLRERRVSLERQRQAMTEQVIQRTLRFLPPSSSSSTTPSRVGHSNSSAMSSDKEINALTQSTGVLYEALNACRDLHRLRVATYKHGSDVATTSKRDEQREQETRREAKCIEVSALTNREALLEDSCRNQLNLLRVSLQRRDELLKRRADLRRNRAHGGNDNEAEHNAVLRIDDGNNGGEAATSKTQPHQGGGGGGGSGGRGRHSLRSSLETLRFAKQQLFTEWEALRHAVNRKLHHNNNNSGGFLGTPTIASPQRAIASFATSAAGGVTSPSSSRNNNTSTITTTPSGGNRSLHLLSGMLTTPQRRHQDQQPNNASETLHHPSSSSSHFSATRSSPYQQQWMMRSEGRSEEEQPLPWIVPEKFLVQRR